MRRCDQFVLSFGSDLSSPRFHGKSTVCGTGNKIGDGGARWLGEALQLNSMLKELYLSGMCDEISPLASLLS